MIVYLACPYSGTKKEREYRFSCANYAAGYLIRCGYAVFSPITHSHIIVQLCDLPIDWNFWMYYDRKFIEVSKIVYVLRIDGWEKSKGVQAEIEIADELGIPVKFLDIKQCILL